MTTSGRGGLCSLLTVFGAIFATLPLVATPNWTCEAYAAKTTATTAEAGNLMQLPGTLLTVENNTGAWGIESMGKPSVLTDGQIPCKSGAGNSYSVGNDAVMTITFPGKADVDSLCLWTSHTDSHRCGVRILSVEALTEGGGKVPVVSETYQKNIDPEAESGSFWYRLSNADGTRLAEGIKSLTITFGQMHNNGTLMEEVEVIGQITEVASYTVTFVNHEGTVLSVLTDVASGTDVTAQAPTPPVREGYVFIGWSEDLSQVTADLTIRPVYVEVGKPIWADCKAWDDTTRPDYGDDINLFAQDGVTLDVDRGECGFEYGDLSALTDGVITTSSSSPSVYTIGDNSSLTFTLPYAQDIGSFELYTRWLDGGRDGLKIDKLEYKSNTDATEWTPIPLEPISFGLNDNSSLKSYYIRAYCPDLISPLAANAQVFRVSFETSDNKGTGIAEVRASRFVTPQYAWVGASWDKSQDVELPVKDNLLGNNLMRKDGAALSIISNTPHDSLYSCTDLTVLTDGILKVGKSLPGAIYPLGSGAVVECRFDSPKDVNGIRLHTYFTNGARDGIAVRTLYVQNAGEDFFRRIDSVAPWSYGVGDDASGGALAATLSAPAGECLFSRISALRLEFGTLDHTCSTFSEIEVFGRSASRPLFIRIR